MVPSTLPSEPTRLEFDQPATAASVTVLEPKSPAGNVKVRELGSVPSASSSSAKSLQPAPVVVKPKSLARPAAHP